MEILPTTIIPRAISTASAATRSLAARTTARVTFMRRTFICVSASTSVLAPGVAASRPLYSESDEVGRDCTNRHPRSTMILSLALPLAAIISTFNGPGRYWTAQTEPVAPVRKPMLELGKRARLRRQRGPKLQIDFVGQGKRLEEHDRTHHRYRLIAPCHFHGPRTTSVETDSSTRTGGTQTDSSPNVCPPRSL
ncbi:hypothetical protein C8F01DRAFT_270621 [Mycena amicta]|nr:hypothetical protein C8F01DRAFT_270621 [Mycena amicta]